MSSIRVDQAGDHVENRGLAGAIRTEQADCFATSHVERHAAHHHAAAETFLDAVRSKISRTRSLPTVATTPLLRDAVRLLATVGPLQRSRLLIHRGLLLCARFGGGENPATPGRTAPELRQLRQKVRELAAHELKLLEHGPSRKP